MQTSNERKQHNETTRNEARNSREDKEKQRGVDTVKGVLQKWMPVTPVINLQ